MAKASKRYAEELEALLQRAARERELLRDLLADLLTPVERDELAVRWQIVKMLDAGIAHRDIVQKLGVGVATVARGARTLLNPSGGFHRLLRLMRGSG